MTPRGEQARAEYERVRSVIWDIDPLGVTDHWEQASDEYDDLARVMVSALHRLDDDAKVDAEWDRRLDEMIGKPTQLTGYAALLHARCTHSFVRSLRGEVSYHAYPRG